jgi:hypothetical protein
MHRRKLLVIRCKPLTGLTPRPRPLARKSTTTNYTNLTDQKREHLGGLALLFSFVARGQLHLEGIAR